jgi:diadenosine tetraphosphate (Ap4A) HIT family hydrolase
MGPEGLNIGINNETAASQTILHLRWHINPRYDDDMKNPASGMRGAIPEKQQSCGCAGAGASFK